jgi:hypothetical protein
MRILHPYVFQSRFLVSSRPVGIFQAPQADGDEENVFVFVGTLKRMAEMFPEQKPEKADLFRFIMRGEDETCDKKIYSFRCQSEENEFELGCDCGYFFIVDRFRDEVDHLWAQPRFRRMACAEQRILMEGLLLAYIAHELRHELQLRCEVLGELPPRESMPPEMPEALGWFFSPEMYQARVDAVCANKGDASHKGRMMATIERDAYFTQAHVLYAWFNLAHCPGVERYRAIRSILLS